MQNQEVVAFDPVFWFLHCNWDMGLGAAQVEQVFLIERADSDGRSYLLFLALKPQP